MNSPGQKRYMERLRLKVRGAVQGVGFRPFVYRLARSLELAGWVRNTSRGVTVEVEGDRQLLEDFLRRIEDDAPPVSIIQDIEVQWLEASDYEGFEIRSSQEGPREALVLPDLATCDDCRREILDPSNRRYRYPFTNCTNCGPRYSIIRSIPYDRPATSMSGFTMCPECRAEYEDPLNRRFHAQPNACPVCGPRIELWDASGCVIATEDEAMKEAEKRLLSGAVVAVKGLGGFHLMTPAGNTGSVDVLRERKSRRQKPLAVMFPSVESIRSCCKLSKVEEDLLRSPQSPIVLLEKRPDLNRDLVCDAVSPGNPELGVMLPYTPLHIILLFDLGLPLVATSGNLSDEPICTDEAEAVRRLGGIADFFLVHNRPIVRHVDDSIARVFRGEVMVLRRARGYAPLPLRADRELPAMMALGPYMKNTLAFSVGRNVFVSQHIGDLKTPQALEAFDEVCESMEVLYRAKPVAAVCDLHPDYPSTARAEGTGLKVIKVQHHAAHIYSCMLEQDLKPPLTGVVWDGTGLGTDGTIWGGEFFTVGEAGCRRHGHLRRFKLPGGDAASVEPRRAAWGLLFEMVPNPARLLPAGTFSREEERLLHSMVEKGVNAPVTSSAGRLFDAVASLLSIHQTIEFEAQAAMALQHAAGGDLCQNSYCFNISEDDGIFVVDWEPMVRDILAERDAGVNAGTISARFHCTLGEMIARVCSLLGQKNVVLSGGCFQNVLLLEQACLKLEAAGMKPLYSRLLPCNDGGVSPGQILAASMN